MTAEQLRQLENDLWEAADQLRANSKLTATEYTMPVLGLIFLRQASNRFDQIKAEVEPTLPVRNGKRMQLTKEVFLERAAIYLPKEAHYDYLAELPKGTDVGAAIDTAMRLIESEYEQLSGVLPKTYTLFEKDLLESLIRIFNKEALKKATGDVFGKIYEYFLNEFAMTGAQEGGEFFTPMSLVQTIVNFIEPDHGTILDPACGSAGMFVQSGYFIERMNVNPNKVATFFGQEKTSTNTNIAKMNLAVHGLEGLILEGNTFYEDKHELVGKCDFVMANPPFNVDKVDKEKEVVKKDPRLTFGLPKNDNANYLWIQYFYSYLNETGRAGFVMASSASDAGHSEKLIREQLVKTGAVDVMVAIGNNFFYTRSLPCTLWFYDRSKEKDPQRADKILMLDARKVFRKVTTTINDFSPEQLHSLTSIVKAYRGDTNAIKEHTCAFIKAYIRYSKPVYNHLQHFYVACKTGVTEILSYDNDLIKQRLKDLLPFETRPDSLKLIEKKLPVYDPQYEKFDFNQCIRVHKETMNDTSIKDFQREAHKIVQKIKEAVSVVASEFGLNKIKEWKKIDANYHIKELSEYITLIDTQVHEIERYKKAAEWLFRRFPDGVYKDVEGLCKAVSRQEISEKDYSLSPGRYVGVDTRTRDNIDYEERLEQIHLELEQLNVEAAELTRIISQNYKGVFS